MLLRNALHPAWEIGPQGPRQFRALLSAFEISEHSTSPTLISRRVDPIAQVPNPWAIAGLHSRDPKEFKGVVLVFLVKQGVGRSKVAPQALIVTAAL